MIHSVIQFIQDGKLESIDFTKTDLPPATTLLNYLRQSPCHKGTKEGCAEGDCGACTVVLAEPDQEGQMTYTAVDSCLVLLPMIHGKQLITVENLSGENTGLHPVQRALVDNHGSQCGYCTPGFVMSLFALYKKGTVPDKSEIEDALTGNLCRCTGYRPIIDSAAKSCTGSKTDLFTDSEKATAGKLIEIKNAGHSLQLNSSGQCYYQPRHIEEALAIMKNHPEIITISGATDIALRITKRHEFLPSILDISSVQELKKIEISDQDVVIDAGVPLERIRTSLRDQLPALCEMLDVFGSRQIRSLATLGGNLGSASPIGDTLPVLIAMNAVVKLMSLSESRDVPVSEFITGYRQTLRKPDELITGVKIPLKSKGTEIRSYKISKRKDLDISTVSGGFSIRIEDGIVKDIILAFGGMAAKTERATTAEELIKGKPWNSETIRAASETIYHFFTPRSDARSGDEFRRLAARNLLLRFWEETRDPATR